MKNRDYKQFAKGEYYHVFNRGNGKMDIFTEKSDFEFFTDRCEEYLFPSRRAPSASKRGVRKSFPENCFTFVTYCLMPNHFHILVRQNTETPISELMLSICSGYSKYFNKKYDRVGSLFQDQFKAVRVENNEQLLWLSAYIDSNPKVAGLVTDLLEYRYSNYPAVQDSSILSLCDLSVILDQVGGKEAYRDFVETSAEIIHARKAELAAVLID